MAKRVLLLTGVERRHNYMRMKLAAAPNINIVRTYCEDASLSLANRMAAVAACAPAMQRHIKEREISEDFFFKEFCEANPDISQPVFIKKGDINAAPVLKEAEALNVDVVVCFGSSILSSLWLDLFNGKILNLHLGLSPYYRGSGTNFWAMADGRFDRVGATFMQMDAGIDTGRIFHQIRAEVGTVDGVHKIGNRLILKAADCFPGVIQAYSAAAQFAPDGFFPSGGKLFKRNDFSAETVECFQKSFPESLRKYLASAEVFEKETPIYDGLGDYPL